MHKPPVVKHPWNLVNNWKRNPANPRQDVSTGPARENEVYLAKENEV